MRKLILIAMFALTACAVREDEEANKAAKAKADCEQSQPGIVNPDCNEG